MDNYIKEIVDDLKKVLEIEIIALGGSRGRNNYDKKSDYDIYIYYNKYIEKSKRKNILDKYMKYMEYDNRYWEEEDDGILLNGIEVEFIYRDINFLQEQYDKIYINNNTQFGYTTCNIENIYTSKILFDRNGILDKYKKIFEVYPEGLRKKIIINNLQLLHDKLPSFGYQVVKALSRQDIISVNNRLTEYFAVYMDIIFALNYKYNIGEKRLLDELKQCEILPKDAVRDIESLFKNYASDSEYSITLINKISNDMYKLIKNILPEYKKN